MGRFLVRVELANNEDVVLAQLGQIKPGEVLEDLDFLVDSTHQRLVPRDPKMIISEAE